MNRLLRPAAVLLASLTTFVGGYLLLARMLPDPAPRDPSAGPVPRLPHDSQGIVGQTQGVTLRTHDPATGRPVADIRVGTYRRTGPAEVELGEISATVRLRGSDGARSVGAVVLTSPRGTADLDAPPGGLAGRIDSTVFGDVETARLRDVTMFWYASVADLIRGPAGAAATLRVDNLQIDFVRATVTTADTVIDGTTVLAEDVPVAVRGRQVDFDGYGLDFRWDPASGRPVYLEVARGERLVVKDPDVFLSGQPAPVARRDHSGPMLASAAGAGFVVARAEETGEPFVATIDGTGHPVLAEQGGETLAEADWLQAVFTLRLPDASAPPAPTPAPSAARPAAGSGARPAPPQAADRAAPARPETPPVVVTWSGPLRVEPAGDDEPPLADASDRRVRMEGSPLVLRQDGVHVVGRRLTLDAAADELWIFGDDSSPVTLSDAAGGRMLVPLLRVRPGRGDADTQGSGSAELPADGDSGGPVRLAWQGGCDFLLDDGAGAGSLSLRGMTAYGGVTVDHPDFTLESERFGVSTDGPGRTVRRAEAGGGVRASFVAESGASVIDADRLTVDFADGPDGPATLTARGDVRAEVDGQLLRAQALSATVAGPDGGRELTSLDAAGNVRGTDDAGRSLRAERLEVVGGESGRTVVLSGDAEVETEQGRVSGEVVRLTTSDGDQPPQIDVPGPGRLDGRTDGGLPVAVTWAGALASRGDAVDVTEAVHVRTVEEVDGVRREAGVSAAKATLRLTGSADDRGLERVELSGEVRAELAESPADDPRTLLRSFDLRTERLDAIPTPGGGSAAVDSPGPGRMLFRDLRTPESGDDESPRGTFVLGWEERLTHDPDARRLTTHGDATAIYEPADRNDPRPPFRLTADRFEAETTRVDGQDVLSSAAASGGVRFSAEAVDFEADTLRYDPATETFTAEGRNGVRLFDAAGVPTGRFGLLVYNHRTGQIDRLTDFGVSP